MSRLEYVTLVDEQDNAIGTEEKLNAHHQGVLHRAFSILILSDHSPNPEVLLQHRSNMKYHSPGVWTNTCCGHPRPHEKTIDAAERRLEEEMGFTCSLTEIGHFIYRAALENALIEHEYDHVFIGVLSDKSAVSLNPEEAMGAEWVSLSEISTFMDKNKSNLSAWLPHVVKCVQTHLTEQK